MIAPKDLVLTADRVSLRKLAEPDTKALFAMFSHPEVMRYWSRPAMTEMAQAEAFVQQIQTDYETGNSLPLAIERSCDHVFVGNCTLHHFHETSRRAEIGYALARPFWGQGYMHEALRALLTYAFEPLDLNRLEADIDPRNVSSAQASSASDFGKRPFTRTLDRRWRSLGHRVLWTPAQRMAQSLINRIDRT
jgi:RimJ/RimL family protein N-acetyltransferase